MTSPSPEQNAALARARDYVGLFISAEAQGHPWHYVAPLDGCRSGDTLRIGEALMERLDARTWRITAGEESVTLALRTPATASGVS